MHGCLLTKIGTISLSLRPSDLHRSGLVLSLTEYLRYYIFTFSERNLQSEILFLVWLFFYFLFVIVYFHLFDF